MVYRHEEMDLQRLFVQPALLSGVLVYDDEQSPFTDCIPSHYYEWRSIGKIRNEKQKEASDYYLNKVTQKG